MKNSSTNNSLAKVKNTLENQADNGINFYRSESQLIGDAIDRLVVRVRNYKENYGKKTILLAGCGASNGTSMIAINLAIALSNAGWKTLLVDTDLRKGSQYKRTGRMAKIGLSNYLDDMAMIEEVCYSTNHPNLKYVPCGTSASNPVLLLCSERMKQFTSEMRDTYEFVIFDCPAVTVVPDASVLFLNVDGIALVASLNATTKKQLNSAKREVKKHEDKYYGLIINCVEKPQYKHFFPQQGYFTNKKLEKKHKKWILKEKTQIKGR